MASTDDPIGSSMTEDDDDEPYIKPRIVAGLGTLCLIAFLYISGQPPDGFTLALMLTTSLLFLGVEAAKALLR